MTNSLQFGVFVPVGPGPAETERVKDLLHSLWHYEPSIPWVLLIDDDAHDRELTRVLSPPAACNLVSIRHPRMGFGPGITGGLCSADLVAMDWFERNTGIDFFVKLDTDALVIRSFAESLSHIFTTSPDVGVLGVIGCTCNPNSRLAGFYADAALALSQVLYHSNALDRPAATQSVASIYIDGVGSVTPQQLQEFSRLKPHLGRALVNGYQLGMYCQGGAYAVSSVLISRMQAQGYLRFWREWAALPFPEDVMMGIYTYAVGLKLLSCANPGDVFAVQYQGLPYHPQRLIEEGYSIIHSLKGDEALTETQLRALFREQRVAGIGSVEEKHLASALAVPDPNRNYKSCTGGITK